MKVVVSCPYALEGVKGNSVTARRVAGVLGELGAEARAEHGYGGGEADLMVALHARRGAAAARAFRGKNPEGKVVVMLTGTDLYGDLPAGEGECLGAMREADFLVVAGEEQLDDVPAGFRGKARVARASVELPERAEVAAPEGRRVVTVVGHLREVKGPFLLCEALLELGALEGGKGRRDAVVPLRVAARHLGAELEEGMAERAREWEGRLAGRYSWEGGVTRAEVRGWLEASWLTVNSSWMEGGANALGEAVLLGVPVLASRVGGNLVMLGRDYGGYFAAGDAAGLAGLLRRCAEEPGFLERLRGQVAARRPLMTREREKGDWRRMLREVGLERSV